MKPNRKDSLAQVSTTKQTASIGTTTANAAATPAAASAAPTTESKRIAANIQTNRREDKRLHNLRENVSIIGWMGIIASATMLLCSGLTMQWCNEVVRHFVYALRKTVETERTRVVLRRVIMSVSTSAYFLSAINLLVNMFLLFGVAKLNYKLMLPWLLFHGFLFGLFSHIAIYMSISSLLMDFRIFVILFASFALMLMIFYKVAHEVFVLYKSLRTGEPMEEHRALSDVESNNTYLILQSEA